MNRIFLGSPIHWLIIILLFALGWVGGILRLHVSEFNIFLILLILTTLVALLAVLGTSAPDRRVTRDAITDEDDEGSPGPG